jgi:hypothetical protein
VKVFTDAKWLLRSETRRMLRRTGPSPFPAGMPRPLLVHCCYHKVGTVWFGRVFAEIARQYDLRLHAGPQAELGEADVFLEDHSRIDPDRLPPFRGSHMIRDPRDVVVSAYFYHLRTAEPWALEPGEAWGGLSYQAHLRGLDRSAGLLAEIRRSAGTVIADMTAWDYRDPRFLELRYEDMLADEEAGWRRLFDAWGFAPREAAACVKIALGFSLHRMRKTSKHIRSGQPGEWRRHFGPEHRAAFKALTGDAAVTLGYEPDGSW